MRGEVGMASQSVNWIVQNFQNVGTPDIANAADCKEVRV